MQQNKKRDTKKAAVAEAAPAVKPESKAKSPYMSRGIYNNYAKGMKEKNQKRHSQGLQAIYIRTYEEWSDVS